MVDDGSFRQDLLYRINAVILTVPPLRDRPDEITPLADRFLAEARRRYNITAESIQAGAIALLLSYDWPGNVRELRNVIEHAAINAHGTVVTEGHLRDRLAGPQRSARAPDMRDDTRMRFKERVRNFEVQLIVAALRETGGNQSAAARRLRMPLRTLTHKLRHGDIPIDVSS
jgi:Nif-specific regulatory protein